MPHTSREEHTRPLGSTYDNQVCSIASTLEVIGERWTLLIVRDAMLDLRRFDEFQADLGIARNVLQSRLEQLVAHGVFRKVRYQERPERHEYRLTEKGLDLWPTVVALMQWVTPTQTPTWGRPSCSSIAAARRGRRPPCLRTLRPETRCARCLGDARFQRGRVPPSPAPPQEQNHRFGECLSTGADARIDCLVWAILNATAPRV